MKDKLPKHAHTASPLDVQALRRHILATMGVGLWVDKACATQQTMWSGRMDIPNNDVGGGVFDSKPNPKSSRLKKRSDSTPNEAQNSQTQNTQAIDKPVPDVPPLSSQQGYLQQATATATKFQLVSMRYHHWVLLADNQFMTTQTQGVWQSLQDKLKTEATKTGVVFGTHVVDYDYLKEQDEYSEHKKLNPASARLKGFLFGAFMRELDISGIRVAMLTPLSDGIAFGEMIDKNVVELPMLEQMINNPSLKKQLWAKLHKKL